ncbi:ABC transporter permease [Undibacterium cyanobacteriorum]|uniref:ABC transporter permease n=1 Tax=Undibacterium cyanobacteriorum TaxID=3073561 RepID=A0ABY9RK80_9BURK|nr:ABC transporter permease [Undibacterium sp. 20NA77.5]WMW81633.1 ABC transporter permease [Undibacterium sp. 20NA77.5]
MLEDFQFSTILVSMIRNAPVLLFAAFAGVFAERSGVIDLALEGKMLSSAFAAASVTFLTQNPYWGVAAGIAVSCLIALLQAYVAINQRGNQLVFGIAINIAASGLTFVLAQYFFQLGGRSPDLGSARFAVLDFPMAQWWSSIEPLNWFFGKFLGGHTILVYLAFLLIPIMHWVISHSRFGLRLRAVGENPHAADSAGINVAATRYMSLLWGGVLCSLAGSYLAIVQSGFFLRDMSAGNGFLALTAVVFGNWRPLQTAAGCLMFALFAALQIQMEGIAFPVVGQIPGSLIQMLPYVVTVIVLAGVMAKSVSPKALGTPFVKSR